MNRTVKLHPTLLVTCAALLGLGGIGCASRADVHRVELDAQSARRTAEQALTVAQQAKSMAQDSQDRSLRTEEMVDRSFKRSMRK